MAADKVVHTYDPANVIVTWNGVTFTGFAEDTFVTLSRAGNAFDAVQGADGTVARANKQAKHFSVKLSFLQTSPTNDQLLEALNADIMGNTGIAQMTVTEVLTGKLKFGASAWIEKDPDSDWGNKVGSREWTFHTGPAEYLAMAAV